MHKPARGVGGAAQVQQEASRIRLGLPTAPKGARVTFREVAKDFLAWSKTNKRSWRRDALSLRHLTRYIGDTVLSEITPSDVDRYREARRSDKTPKGGPPF